MRLTLAMVLFVLASVRKSRGAHGSPQRRAMPSPMATVSAEIELANTEDTGMQKAHRPPARRKALVALVRGLLLGVYIVEKDKSLASPAPK